MGLFKKKKITETELKCLEEGCNFICTDLKTLKRHTEWKHPAEKAK